MLLCAHKQLADFCVSPVRYFHSSPILYLLLVYILEMRSQHNPNANVVFSVRLNTRWWKMFVK